MLPVHRWLSMPIYLSLMFPGLLLFSSIPLDIPVQAGEVSEFLHQRGDFQNSRIKFEQEKTGHIAFMGGSITEMNGYRPMMETYFQKRFPETKFKLTAAGISSTCSTTGAFRLQRDVLSQGNVDLFFVEFAVNDDQDAAHTSAECVRGMEGIIRQVRTHNPAAEIVMIYFINPGMLEQIQNGKMPLSMAAHEKVAEHYGVTSFLFAHEVARQITAGELTWKKFGGTHPAPFGNAICANLLQKMLETAWKKPLADQAMITKKSLPKTPVDQFNYGEGKLIDPAEATALEGWKNEIPNWKEIPGGFRSRFGGRKLLCATEAGASLQLEFKGSMVGAYLLAGPDAGIVEASVDGRPFQQIEIFHRFSKGLHYPRTVLFASELSEGKHTLKLRISDKKNDASKGHAVRILNFVANAP